MRAASLLQSVTARDLADADLSLPFTPDWAEPVWHLFVIRHSRRDALQRALSAAGVGTLIHYPIPPHLQEAYRNGGWEGRAFPIAEALASQVLSLPIGPHLVDSAREKVIETMCALYGRVE